MLPPLSERQVLERLVGLRKARQELQDHRFAGVREFVDGSGEKVSFSSDREMAAALAALDREIAALSGAAPTPSTFVFRTSKGL